MYMLLGRQAKIMYTFRIQSIHYNSCSVLVGGKEPAVAIKNVRFTGNNSSIRISSSCSRPLSVALVVVAMR